MKNKKLILAAAALVAVLAALLGIYFLMGPQAGKDADSGAASGTADALKTVTVTVVHKDGTEKVFTYHTEEEKLGTLLVKEGLIQGENGMYTVVDGEEAVWSVDNGWWAFYIGQDMASQGMDSTDISDGDSFQLVYTVG